jgi:hypothetical protein
MHGDKKRYSLFTITVFILVTVVWILNEKSYERGADQSVLGSEPIDTSTTTTDVVLETTHIPSPATDQESQHDGNVSPSAVASDHFSKDQPNHENSSKVDQFLQAALADGKSKNTPFVTFKPDGTVQVYLQLSNVEQENLSELSATGFTIEVVNSDLNKVQGWILPDALENLTDLHNVVKVMVPGYARVRAGSVVTQGDAILKANKLRQLGFSGKGIKVGIVSDGSDDWHTSRASGDLPQNVTTYGTCTIGVADPQNCRPGGGKCNEGTAMAEIIHDLAPDAELAIAAAGTSLEFIQQINRLATEFRADMIVDELGFYGEPYFEDGEIAKAVAALPSKVLYVSAAGNSANSHFAGIQSGFSSCCGISDNTFRYDRDDSSAESMFHGFLVPRRTGVFVILQWDGRAQSAGANTRLDIYDGRTLTARRVIESSNINNNGTGQYIEGVCVYNPGSSSALRFASVKGVDPGQEIKMFFLGASAIEHPISRGSIFGHAAVDRALTVGTINADEPGVDNIAFYSSRGPSQFNFVNESTELESKQRRKPDLVGVDGVRVSGAGGFSSNFYGTSAAAPHVAGIAAQLMSVSPLVKANNVRKALLSGAVDLGNSGFDYTYGYGRVDALRALSELHYGNPAPMLLLLLDDE